MVTLPYTGVGSFCGRLTAWCPYLAQWGEYSVCVSSYCGRIPAWCPYLAQWGEYSVCVSVLTVAGYLLGALTFPNGVNTVGVCQFLRWQVTCLVPLPCPMG